MLLKILATAFFLLAPPSVPGAADDLAGKSAPGFTLKDPHGAMVHLSDYKGRVVLLNFWATWCTGCKQEIPWFMEFQTRYEADGLVVIGVSLDDEGWKVLTPYLTEHSMNYTVLLGNDEVAGLYGGVDALPTTLLIGRDGKIATMHTGVVDREICRKEIETLLAGK